MTERTTEKVNSDETKTPKAIPFILCNIFLERFCTSGIIAILTLFLHQKLNYDKNMSTALFHTYELLTYWFTIIGAIFAESWIGLFKSLIWSTVIYSFGSVIVSVAAIDNLELPTQAIPVMTVIGLFGTIIASGSLKSNLNVFAGNQFKLPEQSEKLTSYFSIQYFAVKCGSLIARALYPIVREDVKCFGMNDCYPLAFLLPSAGMFLGFLIFMCGRKTYVHETPKGNMLLRVVGCITNAITQKIKRPKTDIRSHWLDFASEKHGEKLVQDTKNVLNVLVMYLPLPIIWALHTQQGSRWVFQAKQMDGDIGFYVVKPDQVMILNSVLGVIMIPVFEKLLYPILSCVGIKTPLQKMALGGALSATSFILAGFLQLQIDQRFISILWMLPQYFVLVLGEILIYTANLNFAYTEAPSSMKSVMMGFMYLTVAGGSLIVILISGVAFFESQAYEFLFFAGITFVDVFIFGFLATRYKYVDQTVS